MTRLLVMAALSGLIACPAPGTHGGGGGGGGASLDPGACGQINTSKVGRKLYAFLVASSELDTASLELEGTVRDACKRMAIALGTSGEGTTKDVCTRASNELAANLQVSVKTEKRLVTRYDPPVCHTDLSVTAGFVAECEASGSADVDVRCHGRCGGTCNGTCSTALVAGRCDGTCSGRCSGECDGSADVQASAECKASAEVHASTHTTCTEAKVEVVQQDVTIVDDSKFQKAMAAINTGLPAIIRAQKRLELAGEALAQWVTTGASLVASAGDLAAQLGEKGLCVGGQIAAIVAASSQIQARFSVSIEVSASVSASAGATAR